MELPQHIFRAYDIRGIVDEDLTEDVVRQIGLGFGSLMASEGRRKVAVGYDVRSSSPIFAAALAQGIQQSGVSVVSIGEVPTPVLYYSIAHLGLDGGIMVTGSHNPINYNGLKICRGIWPIWGEEIERLRTIAAGAKPAPEQGSYEETDVLPDYLDELGTKFKIRPGLRVAIDCGRRAEVGAGLRVRGSELLCLYPGGALELEHIGRAGGGCHVLGAHHDGVVVDGHGPAELVAGDTVTGSEARGLCPAAAVVVEYVDCAGSHAHLVGAHHGGLAVHCHRGPEEVTGRGVGGCQLRLYCRATGLGGECPCPPAQSEHPKS